MGGVVHGAQADVGDLAHAQHVRGCRGRGADTIDKLSFVSRELSKLTTRKQTARKNIFREKGDAGLTVFLAACGGGGAGLTARLAAGAHSVAALVLAVALLDAVQQPVQGHAVHLPLLRTLVLLT